MSEPNGNAKIQNIIGWLTLCFIFLSACAAAFVVPLQDQNKNLKEQMKEQKIALEEKIKYLEENVKEFKIIYQKNHDDMDNRLQREMREVNNITEIKLSDLDQKIHKEMELYLHIANQIQGVK